MPKPQATNNPTAHRVRAILGRVTTDGGESAANEDLVGFVESGDTLSAWVIDGATQLHDENWNPAPNVVEFVQAVSSALEMYSLDRVSGRTVLSRAMDAVRRSAKWQQVVRTAPVHLWPLATVAWVRAKQGRAGLNLEAVIVGDCRVLVRSPTRVVLWGPTKPPEGELALNNALRKTPPNSNERRALARDFLQARRAAQNQEHPARALSLSQSEISMRVRRMVCREPASAFAMTDGLFRLCDLLHVYSQAEFADRLMGPWQDVFRTLRDREVALTQGHYTRNKVHDDASVVEIKIQPS